MDFMAGQGWDQRSIVNGHQKSRRPEADPESVTETRFPPS